MTDAQQLLGAARTIVLVDWPSREVPDTLARGGWAVFVKGGPAPDAYRGYEVRGGEVVTRPVGSPPDHADLVYAHRPLDELPGIVALARSLRAGAVWIQSGRDQDGGRDPAGTWLSPEQASAARAAAEPAGLAVVHDTYIVDAARRLGRSGGTGGA